MAVKRFSTSFISESGQDKSANFLANYSPAIDEMDLIERITLQSTQGSITFSNIPQNFNHLKIIGLTKESGTGTGGPNIVASFNADNTQSNYWSHYINYNGSTVTSGGVNASGYYCLLGNTATSNASYASMFGVLDADILEYRSTSKFKTVRSIGSHDRNGSGEITINSAIWQSTSAIVSVSLSIPGSSFAANTSIALYGVK